MGPIQTLIGKALAVSGGAIAFGKKSNENENEGQTPEEQEKEAQSSLAAKTVKTAQDKKIDSPKSVYFWGNTEEALGTSSEVASVLATQSLHNAATSKTRARDKVRARKQELIRRKVASAAK